jgi:ATP-dependent Clp protease ATP-binding subunit ClpC
MTSNVGADILQRNNSLGFGVETSGLNEFEKAKEKILEETKKVFKPEFLNRLNDVVVFTPLLKESMNAIVDLEIKKLSDRLSEKNISMVVTDEVKDFLIEEGYDEKYGARPLRRSVEKHLEDTLAEAILSGSVKEGDTGVIAELVDNEVVFNQEQAV